MRRDDPSAPMLRQQVRAGLGQQLAKEGRRLLDAEAWDKAVEHLQSALQRLPDDTQLLALSDEANAQRHHTAARRAIDRGDYRAAVDEIIGVRVVLEGRSNVAWTVPLRPAVDALAVAVRDAVCGQAQKLADQRQYQEALENLQLASRLSSADAKVANLRDQIAALSAGAKTADLTGTWRAPPGLLTPNGMQLAPEITDFEFTDRGSEITVTAVQLPRQIREFTGQWRRNGTRLEGNFHFVLWDQTSVSAAVTANIKKDSKTLAVEWKQIRYTDLKKKEFKLEGYVDWTRVE
jgi:tetratricopeptide (TPR) repeat protein